MKSEKRFIEGNIAIVEGAIAAGARFYAGYPISPSSEIAEYSSKMLPKVGGMYIQMEDEISSMGRCWVPRRRERRRIQPPAGLAFP